MASLLHSIFYQPVLNLLFLVYNNVVADVGIAIVIVTVLVRLLLLPLFYKSAKDQTIMQRIAPQIRKIQKDHKSDKERQAREIMSVYKEHKVNPFSSFLLLLVQLPILIALYSVFMKGFAPSVLEELYSFVAVPSTVNTSFLGIVDLSSRNMILVMCAGALQYLQSFLLMKTTKHRSQPGTDAAAIAERVSRNMMMLGPVLTVVILYSLPSAVALYWLTTAAFSTIQQVIINKTVRIDAPGDTTGS
jgi:YidC/Oxa1 family membrane protein insertase